MHVLSIISRTDAATFSDPANTGQIVAAEQRKRGENIPHSGPTENDNEQHERFLLRRKGRPRCAERLPSGRDAGRLRLDARPVLLTLFGHGALTIRMTIAINKTARGFAGPRAAIAPRRPA